MKSMYSMIAAMFISLTLVGCDSNDGFDKDLTNDKQAQIQMRGEVLHRVDFANKVEGKSIKATNDLLSYGIIFKSPTRKPNVIAFTCSIQHKQGAITHTVLDDYDRAVREESTVSIMAYRKDIKEVTEMDENNVPLWSMAEGDTDFVAGMNKLKNLDKDTPVAFLIETMGDDGQMYTKAWSSMTTAGALYKAWDALPWKHCANTQIDLDDPASVTGLTNEEFSGKN